MCVCVSYITSFSIVAETSFFLGNKGKTDCPGGVAIKDEITCRIACTNLGLSLEKRPIIDGFDCFKSSGGSCVQDGGNGPGRWLVCKTEGTFLLS